MNSPGLAPHDGDAVDGPAAAAPAAATAAGARPTARERILKAAEESIVRHGLTRTSMVDVARTAGVGRTTVYRHWKDLDALLSELLTVMSVEVLDRVDLKPETLDGLADSVADIAEAARTSPLLRAIRVHEPELMAVYSYQRMGTSQSLFIDLLAARMTHVAQTDARITRRDPGRVATVLLLALQGAVLSAETAGDAVQDTDWRDEFRQLAYGYLAE